MRGRTIQLLKKIDTYRNHFYVTRLTNGRLALLEKGINQIAKVKRADSMRMPAILIRSSPHKIGSEDTPWQDIFDVDNGHIRYYGDNKTPGKDPASDGNKILIEAFDTYNNPDKRHLSVPLIFYKAVSRNKKSKGFVEFNGFGIIKGIELVTQYDRQLDRTFSNYAFNFQVFSLTSDNEQFDWRWVNDRRNGNITLQQSLRYAPSSWKEWIKYGNTVLEKTRRRVSKLLTAPKSQQVPAKGSIEEKTLKEIYRHYYHQKAKFEGLASVITAKILGAKAGKYYLGWITPSTSDGGADFYGRLEIGEGFGKAKLIVLGQAKCENPNNATGGNHIGRTVARLRRGWVGVYVTTSFFSEAVQREIIEDGYPILLVNGLKLAETVIKILHEDNFISLSIFLDTVDKKYGDTVSIRRPDELLYE